MNIAARVRISHEIDQLLRQVRDLVLAGENLERVGERLRAPGPLTPEHVQLLARTLAAALPAA